MVLTDFKMFKSSLFRLVFFNYFLRYPQFIFDSQVPIIALYSSRFFIENCTNFYQLSTETAEVETIAIGVQRANVDIAGTNQKRCDTEPVLQFCVMYNYVLSVLNWIKKISDKQKIFWIKMQLQLQAFWVDENYNWFGN